MSRLRILVPTMLSALVWSGGARGGDGTEPITKGTLAERAARLASPGMRRNDARLLQLTGDLDALPDLRKEPFASRYGYRSGVLYTVDEPQWVRFDLGRRFRIDRIAVVPAQVPGLGARGEGYGFPLRFKIEVADGPGMEGAVTVVDRTAGDVVNPGRFPLTIGIEPVEGRYLRFTSTRHVPGDEGFLWALEELVVLSGNSLAGVTGTQRASSGLELFPHWSLQRINDGQSALGLPVTTEPSPSKGFLSAETDDPTAEKWLEIDLGKAYPVDEIRLIAVDAKDPEVAGGRGFPREMVVALSHEPGFADPVWQFATGSGKLLGYPGGCPLVLPTSTATAPARYLRIATRDLWARNHSYTFALAEVQVYSGGENVALGKPVRVSDSTERPLSEGWAPAFVVDGFTSQHRLIEYPEYLDLIDRRRLLQAERDRAFSQRETTVRRTHLFLNYGGGTLAVVALCGWGWMLARQRTIQRRALDHLRDQIARDLHDDIGSNLGGIVLLSEMGSRNGGDALDRENFTTIREAAVETSQSLQDIVWLIQRGDTGLRDLVLRMRNSAEVILGDDIVTMEVDPPDFQDRSVSLYFRRHFFFAFKETLNNIRKHSGATSAEVRLTIRSRGLGFEARDNGSGFDPEQIGERGHGLANLRKRAERLKGSCQIVSSPGTGSRVSFNAPTTDSLL